MNTKVKTSFLLILLTLLIFSVALSAVCFLFLNKTQTFADSEITARLFLPQTELENYSLNSPTEVYSDDNVTAIVQNDNNSLTVCYKGKTRTFSGSEQAKDFKCVSLLNSNTLVFSSAARLRKINLENFLTEKPEIEYLSPIFENKAVSHFDLNENYLVTNYLGTLSLYSINSETEFEEIASRNTNNSDYSSVSINAANKILFIYTNTEENRNITGIHYLYAEHFTSTPIFVTNDTPTKIISNEQDIYYLYSGNIYSRSQNGGEEIPLSAPEQPENYLGDISNPPSSISFRNGNLLVSDTTLNAIQEFKINDNTLEFTGYAIANGKPAYNRITAHASDIEKCGNTIAVLDDQKLTITTTDNSDTYAFSNYKNYYVNDTIASSDKFFALGSSYVLIANNSSLINLINLGDNSTTQINLGNDNHIYDVCYQSGKFYIYAYTTSTSRVVYSINEKAETLIVESVFNDTEDFEFINVDVFGNVYLANKTSIYKFTKNDNSYAKTLIVENRTDIKKVITDIGGEVYFLDSSKIYCVKDQKIELIEIKSPTEAEIKSFAMDMITSDVYFIYKDSEFICSTNEIENLALDDVVLTDKFATTANTADFDNLKFYKPINGANAYSITKDQDGIKFIGLIEERNEYVYICDLTVSNSYRSITLRALAGQTEIVLVNAEETTSIDIVKAEPIPKTAFTTTGVNMYYIPVITKDLEYSLSNSNGVIRLNKGCEIHPEQRFTFLGNEFYFASVEIDGNTVKGYIPTAFTVEVLSEDFKWDEYSFVKVKATTLFEDENLTNAIAELSDNQVARLISVKDDVAYIAVKIDGQWVQGYVKESDVKNEPSLAVRNALIIIAVAACVCATTAYFILRKKED